MSSLVLLSTMDVRPCHIEKGTVSAMRGMPMSIIMNSSIYWLENQRLAHSSVS